MDLIIKKIFFFLQKLSFKRTISDVSILSYYILDYHNFERKKIKNKKFCRSRVWMFSDNFSLVNKGNQNPPPCLPCNYLCIRTYIERVDERVGLLLSRKFLEKKKEKKSLACIYKLLWVHIYIHTYIHNVLHPQRSLAST